MYHNVWNIEPQKLHEMTHVRPIIPQVVFQKRILERFQFTMLFYITKLTLTHYVVFLWEAKRRLNEEGPISNPGSLAPKPWVQ